MAAWTIKQALDHNYLVSGQLTNYHKSKVQFRRMLAIHKREMAQTFQVIPIENINKYLGCINMGGPRRRTQDFSDLKKKLVRS